MHRPLNPEAVTPEAGGVNKLITWHQHILAMSPSGDICSLLMLRMTTAAKNGNSILLDRETRKLFSDTGKYFFNLYLAVLLLTRTKHAGRIEQDLHELIIAQKPKYSCRV